MTLEYFHPLTEVQEKVDVHCAQKMCSTTDDLDDSFIDPADLLQLLQSDDDFIEEGCNGLTHIMTDNISTSNSMDSEINFDSLFDDDSVQEKKRANLSNSTMNPSKDESVLNMKTNISHTHPSMSSSNEIDFKSHNQSRKIAQNVNSNNDYNGWPRENYSLNQFNHQQNPPKKTLFTNASVSSSSMDRSTMSFEQQFSQTKDNLFKSMQQSELSGAHIEKVIDKRIIRRHSSNTAELISSRKRLQEMIVDNPNYQDESRVGLVIDTNVLNVHALKRPFSAGIRRPSLKSLGGSVRRPSLLSLGETSNLSDTRILEMEPLEPFGVDLVGPARRDFRRSSWSAGNTFTFPTPQSLEEELSIPASLRHHPDAYFDNAHFRNNILRHSSDNYRHP